ncbi:hypothetical protein B0I37DRAFT_397536 [Chaetomium sp. MPI-CAGE-AT-0009]|nr:hypothetical protein B0I37DRAFT_397536 [Chaetomium sp. MPI-CAGE-AT-0009]
MLLLLLLLMLLIVLLLIVVVVVLKVEVVAMVVVVSMMGMTRRVSKVEVEVESVVGRGTGGNSLEVGVPVDSADSDSDDDGDGAAGGVTSGSIVRVRVAVPVERVMRAVRVMGLTTSISEDDSEGDSEGDPEGDSELVVVELTVELTSEEDGDKLNSEEDGDNREEAEERIDDSVVGVGSTVTVTVPIPLVTVTMAVLVLRLVELPVDDSSVDEPGSIASGMVPRTCLATAISVQPRMAPSVVFIGIAKQALFASLQRRIFQASPSAQVANPPATHATWPCWHADCSVREKLEERPVVTGNSVDVAELRVVNVAVELEKKPEVEEVRPDPVPNTGTEGIIELAVVEAVEVEELSVADRLELSIEADERDEDTSLMGVTTGRPVGAATRGKVMAL